MVMLFGEGKVEGATYVPLALMEPGPERLQVTGVPAVTFTVKVCDPPMGIVAVFGVIASEATGVTGATGVLVLLLLLPPPQATMVKITKQDKKKTKIPRIICSIPERGTTNIPSIKRLATLEPLKVRVQAWLKRI
jgi:hypothetical protein